MTWSEEGIGRLPPRALTELMRGEPSHRLYRLGLVALGEMVQAQMTPEGVDNVLAWEGEFTQAYDGYWQAEILGFQEQ